MPAVSQTLALVAPTITAQAIFSSRRAQKGVENMDNDPLFSLINFDIALGQFLKGARAVKTASAVMNNGASDLISQASTVASTVGKTSKVARGFGKVLDFTAYHINPIIWLAALVKGLNNDDESRATALTRELAPVAVMRIAEEIYCDQLGMPITFKNKLGKQVNTARTCKLFSRKQAEAIKDFKFIKNMSPKTLSTVGSSIKGLGFVLTSIFAYRLGEKITTAVLGERSQKTQLAAVPVSSAA